MKLHISRYIIILATLILCGCNDFLDEAPRGNAIASKTEDYDKLFNDAQGFNMLLSEQYYALWKSDDLIFNDDCMNTIAMAGGFPTSVQAAIEFKDKVYRDDESTNEWQYCTKSIYKFNVIIEEVLNSDGDETLKKELYAEARIMRAYMHFLLAQWYAMPYNEQTADTEFAIPIIKAADTQIMKYDRVSVRELYNWIISEMEESVNDLKDRQEHRMRCYRPTGHALLGKVYFFMGKYDKALPHLQSAFESLKNDKNVYLTDHVAKQSVYGYSEIPVMDVISYVPYTYRDNEALYCIFSVSMRNYYMPYYGTAPTDYLKPEVYALYSADDLRRNIIITKDAMGNPLPYPTATFIGCMTNIGCSLPELYIMLAETEARVGSLAESRNVIEALRETRFRNGKGKIDSSIDTRDKMIKLCIDEFSREFAGTGYRFYTVRRLWDDPVFQEQKPITHNVGNTVYTLTKSSLKTIFPETVLQWNESWREK